MRGMEANASVFRAEYALELNVARGRLTALAQAAPEELFEWRPVEGVRTFSEVVSHVAAVNFGLLHMAGCGDRPANPFAGIEAADKPALIERMFAVERETRSKQAGAELLARSFDAVEAVVEESGDIEETVGGASLRRFLLRILAHSHEHLGQAVAYARMYGMELPWPDPLKGGEGTAQAR